MSFCPVLVAKYLVMDLSERKVMEWYYDLHKSYKWDAGLCLIEFADAMSLPTRIRSGVDLGFHRL